MVYKNEVKTQSNKKQHITKASNSDGSSDVIFSDHLRTLTILQLVCRHNSTQVKDIV